MPQQGALSGPVLILKRSMGPHGRGDTAVAPHTQQETSVLVRQQKSQRGGSSRPTPERADQEGAAQSSIPPSQPGRTGKRGENTQGLGFIGRC